MSDIYLDIETQRLAQDTPGGWDNIPGLGFACAVTYCECCPEGKYRKWLARTEQEAREIVPHLVLALAEHSRVIGHNLLGFDYAVLAAYSTGLDVYARLTAKTLDTLKYLEDRKRAKRKVSLDDISLASLGHGKSGSGKDSPALWRAGEYDKLLAYCEQDVRLLVELVVFAREHGYVLTQRVDVEW